MNRFTKMKKFREQALIQKDRDRERERERYQKRWKYRVWLRSQVPRIRCKKIVAVPNWANCQDKILNLKERTWRVVTNRTRARHGRT